MSNLSPGESGDLRDLRSIADYQFRPGAGEALFPEGADFIRGKAGRVRQVLLEGRRLASLRAGDGLFTLGVEGGKRLRRAFPPPALRVVVSADAAPFVARGKTSFARHVLATDPAVSPRDEVLVVDEADALVAVGRALLSPREMLEFRSGVAVEVRQGVLEGGEGENRDGGA